MSITDRLPIALTPVGCLPDEKITEILSEIGKLKYYEVIHVAKVCDRLNRLGYDEPLWRKLCLRYFGELEKKGSWKHTFERRFLHYFSSVEQRLGQVTCHFGHSELEQAFGSSILPAQDRKAVYIWHKQEDGSTEGKWHSMRKVEAYCRDRGTSFKDLDFQAHFQKMTSYPTDNPSLITETWNTTNSLCSHPDVEKRYNEFFKDLV